MANVSLMFNVYTDLYLFKHFNFNYANVTKLNFKTYFGAHLEVGLGPQVAFWLRTNGVK